MYQPRRAAGSVEGFSAAPDRTSPDPALVAAGLVRPRRATRSWRDSLAERAVPVAMALAATATVGAIVMSSSASASPSTQIAVPADIAQRDDSLSRSTNRSTISEDPRMQLSAATVSNEITLKPTRTLYAETTLVVREKASSSSDRLGSLKKAAAVTVTPQTRGDYRRVVFKGKDGWVLSSKLATKKPKEPKKDAAASGSGPKATRSVSTKSVLGLRPVAMVVYRAVMARWNVPSVGGYRASSLSVHQFGRAIDFMVYSDKAMGDAIAAYVTANAKAFKVDHVIWRQRIWTPYSPRWRSMADRGSITANHYDHVHVAVKP